MRHQYRAAWVSSTHAHKSPQVYTYGVYNGQSPKAVSNKESPKFVSKQLVLPLNCMIKGLEDTIIDLEAEVDNKNDEIKYLENINEDLERRNESLVEEGQTLVAKVDDLEDEIKGWKEDRAELKDKIDDLDQEVSEYKNIVHHLDKIAYDALVVLCITKRFMPDKYKDLVNLHTMLKLKMNVDDFFDAAYDDLLDIGFDKHGYPLPEFEDRENENNDS